MSAFFASKRSLVRK